MYLAEGLLLSSYVICPCHCLVAQSSMKRVKAKVKSVSVDVNTCFSVRAIYNGAGAVFRNRISPSHKTSRHELKINY